MTDRELTQLAALLERFRDAANYDRREDIRTNTPDEAAVCRALAVVRRSLSGRRMYRGRAA